ncbi:Post-transcriptional regulator MKT1-like protein [Cladobotryum mycophilum]|uniref:Post-transcriptional regulator MKT1-like protein n=1 Tax=Cladobotryum mycophilum TaxID=491253 RepID=A0ABR0SNZ1_9HYPO
MPFLVEDSWINGQASTFDIAELEDCAIAVDATYYLSLLLDTAPAHEPLLPALGGLTGIQAHIKENLDLWDKHRIIPFFIFDGQSIIGQDDIAFKRGKAANRKTDEAWTLYSQTQPEQAVSTFGANPGAFRLQNLYPLLQSILQERELHFLVAPYNACAQKKLAHFEMVNTEQCAGVMGPQELLLYPIQDTVIRSFDWEAKTVTGISKKRVMRALSVNEPMFIDAMLMTGTSFLPSFPPLQDASMYPNSFSIMEAVNILRTSDKSVANACASFNDILQAQDANWPDKYRKARMAAHHFIYITESGEVLVNDFERLTKDNHEYLGLQMPAELFHYLNTGLIGSRILNGITHSQIIILPTLEGSASSEYKKLVTSQILPIREQTLGLIIPRVHRGIGHKDITMRVWFDPSFSYILNPRSAQPSPSQQVGTWDVKEDVLGQFFPADFAGPVYLEVLALANQDFVEKTISREKPIRGIDSTNMVTSVAIWRFLHLRGYVDDSHKLTKWGNALATSLMALKEAMDARSDVPGIEEAALLAFELIRFGLLNGRPQTDDAGMPRKGTEEDKASLMLISQCATLLKLRHQVYGYTGPLNRSLLGFRALSSTVREADRDLIEAIVASMFMYGQAKRDRDDHLEISQRLPFSQEPDIALGIAIQTFFDEDEPSHTKEQRGQRLESFPSAFVPFAEALKDDFQVCLEFINALYQGVQTLDSSLLPPADKAAWQRAWNYLDARPF